MAAILNRRTNLEMLLARGADPAKSLGGGLVSAMAFSDVGLFRRLLAKGADPAQRSPLGQDVLTAAVASDTTDPEVVRELIRVGNDPNAQTRHLHADHGYGSGPEVPLDWARRRGETPIVRVLAEFTKKTDWKPDVDESKRLKAETPRAAIAKALPLLYDGGREFFKRSGCTSCHHNMLPALAFSMARSKGIPLDEEKVRRNSQQSVAWLKGNQQTLLQDVEFPGADYTEGYLLVGLAADGYPRDRATDAAVIHLADVQTLEGGWSIFPYRPPLESSPVTATALVIRALGAYPIPQRRSEWQARIRRGAKWLAAYTPRTGEERTMRVLGLSWAETEHHALRAAAEQLLSTQRDDGGWAQLDTLASDAYATGQALYALRAAGRLPPKALDRGVRFLLDNQLADGSWHVRSRSFPVQTNYFDTGFPHGRDQWISAAGTSWACIGLSLSVRP
jgi:N-acyl-D-amino-acid deacylase